MAGEDDFWPNLNAYRLQPDGIVKQILPRWWSSWIVRKLQATSDAINVQQISQAVGYEQWRRESIEQLPAGVFVWRDEFEAAHLQQYGALSMLARSAPKTFDASTYALDFSPEPPPDIAPQHLVLEGFAPGNPQAATTVSDVDSASNETTPAPQAVPVAQPEAIDFGMLATPEKLINAFGNFTGMRKDWFDNLTDTPRLLAARKVAGTGGKHHTPPLFCPFEVMQWLIDEKRKKGRKVSAERAWQLLQGNFEKVYNTRSAGDPR